MKTPFAISIIATDEILLVSLCFRAGADRDAIESCMFQIADAFAVVEGLSQKEVQDLFWEQKRLSPTENCVTLRRRFSDPEYPQKFDAAFQRVTGQLNSALSLDGGQSVRFGTFRTFEIADTPRLS